jgi:hypothetical protein
MTPTAAPTMICARCNKASDEHDRCSTCGTPLKTLASQQRRGWLAFGAGAFLAIFIAAIGTWVDRLFTASGAPQRDAAAAQFLGRLNVVFALVVIAGLLGCANGWLMVRSGRRNFPLMLGMVAVFAAALFLGFTASNGYHPQ